MKRIVEGVVLFSVVILVAVLAGCPRGTTETKNKEMNKAIVVLHPTEGSKVQGVITFTREGKGIHLLADIEGLSPGPHAFHVHEYGDCSSVDANSAGGHFNPTDMPHGAPSDEKRHVGDLGNIEADKSGHARLEMTDTVISLEGPNSIIGRAVIVHAQADDFKTQPTGAAGARVACGVIGVTK